MAGPYRAELQECLLDLADRLDARLCGPNLSFASTSQDTSKVPRVLLLLSEPADLRLHQPGDDIAVTCFAENTAAIFWQFVAEVNHDESLESKARRWSSYEAGEFESYAITSLLSGTRILLSFCRRPAQLVPDNLKSENFPVPSGYGFTLRTIARHNDIKDSLRAFELLQDRSQDVIEAYHRILLWAKAARLQSGSRPLTSSRHILWMLLALPGTLCTVADFFQQYSDLQNISAVKTYTQRSPQQLTFNDINLLAMQAQHVRDTPHLLYSTTEQHFQQFLIDFRHYVVINAELHDSRAADSFEKAVSYVIESLTKLLMQDAKISFRVWPDHCLKHSTFQSRFAMVIGFTNTATHTPDDGASSYLPQVLDDIELGVENATFMVRVTSKPLSSEVIRNLDLRTSTTPTHKRTNGSVASVGTSTARSAAPTRFRSARQIIARLQHDPEHRSISYEVGYLDRFEGLKWKPIDDFSKPTEDEDFIPEHRVKQVRRTEDKIVIWDRASKTDDSHVLQDLSS